jgi:hypothetical protein
MTLDPPLLTTCAEGFVDIDGSTFYVIPDLGPLDPFLMSLVSDSDHWCFISSAGALTAGRRDMETALFPYETDDRLHLATGISGPVTVLRVSAGNGTAVWEPYSRHPVAGVRRAVAKSTLGDVVLFEEANENLGLAMRFRWATSGRFGLVRQTSLVNIGSTKQRVRLVDGIVNVLPAGLAPDQYRTMSNLTNAYRRSEIVAGAGNVALHTVEALMVDQAIPAESLRASVTWSTGLRPSVVTVDRTATTTLRDGAVVEPVDLMTGRPGAHLLMADVELGPGASTDWYLVADVAQDHAAVIDLMQYLESAQDVVGDIEASIEHDSAELVRKVAAADALQSTGDVCASAHHVANVLFNVMRGGVFSDGYRCDPGDFRAFVEERNRVVAESHAAELRALPPEVDHRELVDRAAATGDPDLERLALEYLPLTFSRRHGDPSRPWNRFSIQVRAEGGAPVLRHEGNWRDIFQNWEALCLSFPEYLPSVVAVFVNASTPDGFNPYRITRSGFEWEVPDPDDPWSNIGYWGDHQIVYLLRLLDEADRLVPGVIDRLLERRIFTYADVPYRLHDYGQLVADPRETITYDDAAADRAFARVARLGGDGKLLTNLAGDVHRVSLLEKLLVPALSKLSSFVPGGGIWMNTQRPEWNDANNALVGYGLSMVTLYHLRRYVSRLVELTRGVERDTVAMSAEVAQWLDDVVAILRADADLAGDGHERATLMKALGEAFSSYRSTVYASGFSGMVEVPIDVVTELCAVALPHLDATIRSSRRRDGLFHAYNLIDFRNGGETAAIGRLPEMLEGQVAVLSSGVLGPAETADVVDALFASALFRPDQASFLLYPNRRLPSFLEKNEIPASVVAGNPLLERLVVEGDTELIVRDGAGRYHFNAGMKNASAVESTLQLLGADIRWASLVEAHRSSVLAAYEAVFNHHAFTGRSGAMYAYEGLGSIYWHMVAKLMVAIQECLIEAQRTGADAGVIERLRRGYYRVRAGLGFNKTAAEYGAFPTDPYSHTPAHAGAQQPGMTGQVKEEILTRPGELGVWFDAGEIVLDPVLLRAREFLRSDAEWRFVGADGGSQTKQLAAGSFGLTVCQVPIVVSQAADDAPIEVVRSDGSVVQIDGDRLGREISEAIFSRAGTVDAVRITVPHAAVTLDL